MLDPVVLAALVELVYQICVRYIPQFPISRELINAIIVALLGLFLHETWKVAAPAFAARMREKKLIK